MNGVVPRTSETVLSSSLTPILFMRDRNIARTAEVAFTTRICHNFPKYRRLNMVTVRRGVQTVSVVVIFVLGCLGQDVDRMDLLVRGYVPGQFMGSVLVARGADVLLSKGYGSANLEWEIPNTPQTKFRLGSITKQFTAASILLLEERGKLKVEDPVK